MSSYKYDCICRSVDYGLVNCDATWSCRCSWLLKFWRNVPSASLPPTRPHGVTTQTPRSATSPPWEPQFSDDWIWYYFVSIFLLCIPGCSLPSLTFPFPPCIFHSCPSAETAGWMVRSNHSTFPLGFYRKMEKLLATSIRNFDSPTIKLGLLGSPSFMLNVAVYWQGPVTRMWSSRLWILVRRWAI
jgi:hypothetical protein